MSEYTVNIIPTYLSIREAFQWFQKNQTDIKLAYMAIIGELLMLVVKQSMVIYHENQLSHTGHSCPWTKWYIKCKNIFSIYFWWDDIHISVAIQLNTWKRKYVCIRISLVSGSSKIQLFITVTLYNECDDVSNDRHLNCSLNHLFRHRSKKISKLNFTGLCEGTPPVTCGFPSQKVSNAENVSIWWRHHGCPMTQNSRYMTKSVLGSCPREYWLKHRYLKHGANEIL